MLRISLLSQRLVSLAGCFFHVRLFIELKTKKSYFKKATLSPFLTFFYFYFYFETINPYPSPFFVCFLSLFTLGPVTKYVSTVTKKFYSVHFINVWEDKKLILHLQPINRQSSRGFQRYTNFSNIYRTLTSYKIFWPY